MDCSCRAPVQRRSYRGGFRSPASFSLEATPKKPLSNSPGVVLIPLSTGNPPTTNTPLRNPLRMVAPRTGRRNLLGPHLDPRSANQSSASSSLQAGLGTPNSKSLATVFPSQAWTIPRWIQGRVKVASLANKTERGYSHSVLGSIRGLDSKSVERNLNWSIS